jgi:hypothetical protein
MEDYPRKIKSQQKYFLRELIRVEAYEISSQISEEMDLGPFNKSVAGCIGVNEEGGE